MTTETNTAAPGMGEPTSAMLDAGLPHLIATKSDVRPLGQFYPGMTADESEEANQQYHGRDTVSGSLESHEAAKTYIRDWCPDHVKDYITSLEAQPAPVVGVTDWTVRLAQDSLSADLAGEGIPLPTYEVMQLITRRALLSARPGGEAVAWVVFDSKQDRYVIFNPELASAIAERGLLTLPVFGQYEWLDAKINEWKPINRLPYTWERELGIQWRAHPAQAGGEDR